MTFAETLNDYIDRLDCTLTRLAGASGVSASVISRYRSGTRTPAADSGQLYRLAAGLAALGRQRGLSLDQNEVWHTLCAPLPDAVPKPSSFSTRLGRLMDALEINNARLARHLNYDPSSLSRIRSGRRWPADTMSFAEGMCGYIQQYCGQAETLDILAGLMECPADELADPEKLRSALCLWLCAETPEQPGRVRHFLEALDSFELGEYTAALRFDAAAAPPAAALPESRYYYTIEGMRQAELDFLAATALSDTAGRVFMCSDLQMDDMAQDTEFAKRWMMGLAVLMKRGLNIHIVHYLNRPFEELMLGLESWIPLYMTGQVNPYYLPGVHNRTYGHLNYCSAAAALYGECITGHHAQGRYYLSRTPEDLAYYRKKSAFILEKALPLMEIYREERKADFEAFYRAQYRAGSGWRAILSTPPAATLTPELTGAILARCGVPEPEADRLAAFAAAERAQLDGLLAAGGTRVDELPALSREEFDACPPKLPFAAAFPQMVMRYTWEEYRQHLALTEAYAAAHPGYRAVKSETRSLRNIQVLICPGKWVLVSKEHSPAIHFVIYHPTLRTAIERLSLPVWDSPAQRDENPSGGPGTQDTAAQKWP